MDKIKILGIVGSLRKDSYNKAALNFCKENVPENATLEIFDIKDIPLFNQDNEQNLSGIVKDFKKKIENADCILFSTPEYNYSIPGVLKNAIDFASRPYSDNSFKGKSAGIISASTGSLGGVRVQYHLRQILVSLNLYSLNKPEVMISNSKDKFDSEGKIIDQKTREKLNEFLEALIKWAIKIKENK